MGELYLHDLQPYIENGCTHFVETGTGKGTGLEYAMQFNFRQLYSIEIMRVLWKEALEKFKGDERVHLLHNDSVQGIREVFDYVEGDEPTVWWLDAHFPGADFQLNSYDADWPKHIKTPLEAEIGQITRYKDFTRDVFIIDDLGLYEEGHYQLSNASLKEFRDKLGLTNHFIYDTFRATHTFRKDLRHQGFLILEPK